MYYVGSALQRECNASSIDPYCTTVTLYCNISYLQAISNISKAIWYNYEFYETHMNALRILKQIAVTHSNQSDFISQCVEWCPLYTITTNTQGL